MCGHLLHVFFFFFNDTAPTEIYTLSLHDALPIWGRRTAHGDARLRRLLRRDGGSGPARQIGRHTSELQSQSNLVCRLLLEKKKNTTQRAKTGTTPDRTHGQPAMRLSRSTVQTIPI